MTNQKLRDLLIRLLLLDWDNCASVPCDGLSEKIIEEWIRGMMRFKGLSYDAAKALVFDNYTRTGLTPYGVEGVDAEEFFHYVHERIMEYMSQYVYPRSELTDILHKFADAGVQIGVLTHASRAYTMMGRDLMGLTELIPDHAIFAMDDLGIHPDNTKHYPAPFIHVSQQMGIPLGQIAFADDTPKNAKVAHDLGMIVGGVTGNPKSTANLHNGTCRGGVPQYSMLENFLTYLWDTHFHEQTA